MKKLNFICIIFILGIFFGVASYASAATYYIDYDNGNDTYTGTSKDTPWKHAPGMTGCTGNCAVRQSASPAGDSFIFKGGVRWPRAALPFVWEYGNSTYFGAGDKSWYKGMAWSRPILDCENNEPPPSSFNVGTLDVMFFADGRNQTVDNFEFTGVRQLHGLPNGYQIWMLWIGGAHGDLMGGEVKNCYFHGWSHGPVALGADPDDPNHTVRNLWVGGANAGHKATDSVACLGYQSSAETDLGMKIHDNVFDGSDTSMDMAIAMWECAAGHIYHNYVNHLSNVIASAGLRYVWGNTFKNINYGNPNSPNNAHATFDADEHINAIENNQGNSIIYNNHIEGDNGGNILTYGVNSSTDYYFNNVSLKDTGTTMQAGTRNGSTNPCFYTLNHSWNVYAFNNTLENIINGYFLIDGSGTTGCVDIGTFSVQNNHLIGSNTTMISLGTAGTPILSHNNIMTDSLATTAGYLDSTLYPYYPPSSGSATVNTGTNLSTLCANIPDNGPSLAVEACLGDTTDGVAYDPVNHVVLGDAKKAVPRDTNWDIGAYEYTTTPACLTKGDFTCNGYSISDLQTMISIILGTDSTTSRTQADMNNDTLVNISDLQLLIKKVLGIN